MSEPAEHITVSGAGGAFSPFGQSATGISGVDRQSRVQSASGQKTERERGNRANSANSGDSLELSPEAEEQLRKLQQRDAEVRAHEAAHLAAAGQYAAGGPQFEYQQGPDGKQYAIGGHVNIDVSPVPGDPEETERKAQQIHRAALAPGAPSAQDSKVAASAAQMATEAKIEKSEEKSSGNDAEGIQNGQHLTPEQERGLRFYANSARQGLAPNDAAEQGALALAV